MNNFTKQLSETLLAMAAKSKGLGWGLEVDAAKEKILKLHNQASANREQEAVLKLLDMLDDSAVVIEGEEHPFIYTHDARRYAYKMGLIPEEQASKD